METTLLDDFIKIYNSINCGSDYCSCDDCSNKKDMRYCRRCY